MNTEFWAMRIETVREASSRARWVYAAATIAAMAQLGATWNAAGSQLKSVAFAKGTLALGVDPVLKELQTSLLRYWVESMFVNVPLLGIRFSVADSAIIGSLALTILAVWLFYNVRRENHLIGQTIIDASAESEDVKKYVFHGVIGTQVFTRATRNDGPISSLSAGPLLDYPVIAKISGLLVFLPALAILAVIVSDVLCIFWLDAVFREGHKPIASYLPDTVNLLSLLNWLARDVVALIFGLFTWFLLWRAWQFEHGTTQILREIYEDWSGAPKVRVGQEHQNSDP